MASAEELPPSATAAPSASAAPTPPNSERTEAPDAPSSSYYRDEPVAAPHSASAASGEPGRSSPAPPETPTRRLKPRSHKEPTRGILKAPSVQASRFNFRRDILQPLNSRISTAYGVPEGASTDGAAGGAAGPTAAAVGSLWGKAFQRLSVAAGEAAAGVSARVIADVTGIEKPQPTSPVVISRAAPHTPSRGITTSSVASTSSIATIRSSTSAPIVAAPAAPSLSVGELKRVRFRMATLKVVYPINGPEGSLAPWQEGRTKRRVNEEHRAARLRDSQSGDSKGWTGESLSKLYSECCRTREEFGIDRVRRALRDEPGTPPRLLDLSNEVLSHGAVEALSDLLSVDFGLKKLVLESCGIDDENLKPLLHALLVSGAVPTLSIANNKRIKTKGWKLIAIFIRKAKFLRYLDLSENTIDKRSAEYLVQALTSSHYPDSAAPTPALSPAVAASPSAHLATPHPLPTPPAHEAPQSSLHSMSGIGITDEDDETSHGLQRVSSIDSDASYLDDESEPEESEPLFLDAPLLREGLGRENGMVLSIRLENCGLKGQALEALAHGVRASTLKHISMRRNRITALGAVSLAIMIRDYPVASDPSLDPTSAATATALSGFLSPMPPPTNGQFEPYNSITARQPYLNDAPSSTASDSVDSIASAVSAEPSKSSHPSSADAKSLVAAQLERETWQNSEARTKLKRQIDELPRTGSLLTLDVKDNDIRGGVVYIAQVLKRNRTLKVLNLSENKIDVAGLLSIAEALKFNATLETLDMSRNPCCGPSLEGITALRAAITINSNLKRVFLSATDLTSEGAIALAEFLPEAKGLLHLDLTDNAIGIDGVLGLAVAIKMNRTLRCLDLNVPFNDPGFADLSQQILQACIRNTEIAQEDALARGYKTVISKPILKSVVAANLKSRQEQDSRSRLREATAVRNKDAIIVAAEECRFVLDEILTADEELKRHGVLVRVNDLVKDLIMQAQLAEAQLAEAVAATRSGSQKDQAVLLGDQMSAILDRAKLLYDHQPSGAAPPPTPSKSTPTPSRLAMPPLLQTTQAAENDLLDSPSFSIADSDEEDDLPTEPSSPTPRRMLNPVALVRAASLSPTIPAPGAALDAVVDETTLASPRSPMENHMRFLALEEGEVFRNSAVAIGDRGVDDDELGDVCGEDLKKEILEADVDKGRRPSVTKLDAPVA